MLWLPDSLSHTVTCVAEGTIRLVTVTLLFIWASLVAQMVKNLPATQETRPGFLAWEDPPKKGTATHSRILAWRIPWTSRRLAGYSAWGAKEADVIEQLTLSLFF